MPKKQELSTMTKGLIRKAHGRRKVNNDFWYGSLENKPEAPSKKKRKYSLTRKEWIILVVVCLTLPYIVMHGTDLFKKLILSDEYEVSFSKQEQEPQENIINIEEKYTKSEVYIPPERNGYIYVWKEGDNETYFSSNEKSVPKCNINNLKTIKINRNYIYCWLNEKGKKVYTNGIPSTLAGKYRLIDIKY